MKIGREGLGERTMSSKVCNPAQPQLRMLWVGKYLNPTRKNIVAESSV